ncbi:ABC transporter permease [Aquibium microcysteis]|uniref:ABC transporter permease n=1 Tax=Aquibium microcysteis TaxID=675281 RepID=UPI00165D0EE7|nr:ABC transporter permease [Aquibium microcysteis]
MLTYVALRIGSALPVAVLVALIVFLLVRLTPGDPAAILAGENASPEQLEAIRLSLGLDLPMHRQMLDWAGGILGGDFGTSIISQIPVVTMIGQRLEPTLSLTLITFCLTVLVAIPLGVLAAWKHGTAVDRGVMVFSIIGFSVPVFVLGYTLIQIFSIQLGVLPVQGYRPIGEGLGPFLYRMVLPALTLTLAFTALIARMTRTSMLSVLGEDYIRTARAKGAAEPRVLFRHALRNAFVPIITILGNSFALLIGGVVVTETVFNLPGIGRLTVEAILARDYPVIQGVVLLMSFVYLGINLLVDIAYVAIDPRIRY